jgi:hypothetical protein
MPSASAMIASIPVSSAAGSAAVSVAAAVSAVAVSVVAVCVSVVVDVVVVEDPEFPHPTRAVTTIVKAKIEDNTFFFTFFPPFIHARRIFPGKENEPVRQFFALQVHFRFLDLLFADDNSDIICRISTSCVFAFYK